MLPTKQQDGDSPRVPIKVGLALGSGAARGWAHIGAIQTLRERGHEVVAVAGTSMGALVGAFFAAGKLEALAKTACGLDLQQVLYHFLEFPFQRSGLLDGNRIAAFVRDQLAVRDIRDLPIPFGAVATDLATGAEVVFKDGDIIEAIRASIAAPGIFTPVKRGENVLVDGGLINPVPVSVARAMGADYVIAVDVGRLESGAKSDANSFNSPARVVEDMAGLRRNIERFGASARRRFNRFLRGDGMPHIIDVLGNSIRIIEAQVADAKLKIDPPNLLVRPLLGHLRFMDFHHAEEAIEEGRTAMEEALRYRA